jgi:C-terminal processing protease CtpA/Prc
MMKILCAMLLFSMLALPGHSQGAPAFGGVGIDGVPRADGTIAVRQLVAGGPAHLAGIKAGDIITQVDGTPTAGSDFKFIVERRLRGRAGTPVLILLRRPGNPKILAFKLVRRQLNVAGNGKKEHKGE